MADNDSLTRLFGGPPGKIIIKLAVVSVLVGLVMAALDLDPRALVLGIQRIINGILAMGWDAVMNIINYFLLGAAVVIPIWIVMRLLNGRKQG
jgi:hypothetical protein